MLCLWLRAISYPWPGPIYQSMYAWFPAFLFSPTSLSQVVLIRDVHHQPVLSRSEEGKAELQDLGGQALREKPPRVLWNRGIKIVWPLWHRQAHADYISVQSNRTGQFQLTLLFLICKTVWCIFLFLSTNFNTYGCGLKGAGLRGCPTLQWTIQLSSKTQKNVTAKVIL